MKISNFAKYMIGLTVGAAMLAACSNNGGLAPSGTTAGGGSTGIPGVSHVGKTVMLNGVLLTAAHPNLSGHPGSPVSPDKKKHHKKKPNQYISNFEGSTVDQFDYPKSDASIGTISGVTDAQGECTNVLYGIGKTSSRSAAPARSRP
jgi:hypothetical protein